MYYSNGFEFHYTYDPVGNRLTQTTCAPNVPCGTTTYTYDAANRLISVDGVAYTWDDNGNLLNDGTSTYAYDSQNRLTTLTPSGGGHSYAFSHNGTGDRLSQSADGVETRYTLDLEAGLTQVLSDGTYAYLYGVDRLAQVSASEADYFLGDALGSVRQLVDASGAVRLAKNYEPYGTVMGSTGSGTSAFGYMGEVHNSDLVYLRSRYLNTVDGRFVQRDSWRGDGYRPQSLNTYDYVGNNVSNPTDPTGRCYWPIGWLRQAEPMQCANLDSARGIYFSQQTTIGQKALASYYIGAWATAHAFLLIGVVGTSPVWAPIVAVAGLLSGCSSPPSNMSSPDQSLQPSATNEQAALQSTVELLLSKQRGLSKAGPGDLSFNLATYIGNGEIYTHNHFDPDLDAVTAALVKIYNASGQEVGSVDNQSPASMTFVASKYH